MAAPSSSTDPKELIWPAPVSQMSAAREFLRNCAAADAHTLILPDKDADGLCSGLIVHHTLLHLGLSPTRLSVHFPSKGSNIHTPASQAAIAAFDARFIIATDQGSRAGPPLAPEPARTLVIDHHYSSEFPSGAVVCSAAHCEPVATSATLTYEICQPLLGDSAKDGLRERLEWLCAIGTMGDLGTAFKWEPPFPDIRVCLKKWTKKVLGEAVGLVNAPRRTASYDVPSAWRALLHAASSTLDKERLIATRWASSLKGARLEVVMCANDGYTPGLTNFACRVARAGGGAAKAGVKRKADEGDTEDSKGGTDIIALLKDYAGRVPGLRESMGDDFARGHKQASGGIVRTEDFERLWDVMAHAERADQESPAKKRKLTSTTVQKNTLEGWLKKT
ncbi:hypothetical protein C2E23DRAFT_882531 [Lenzites betulinus]|nr:hypothetical protein C2E23DRAFT_882531 [Lenzites betulinus]